MTVKRALSLGIAVFIFLFALTIFKCPAAKAEDGKDYEKFLKQRTIYANIVNYLRHEQQTAKPKAQAVSLNDYALLFGSDTVFSLFCLWLALFLLIGKRPAKPKNFAWFFLTLNVGWFVFLLLYRVCWDIMDFLVIRLRPDLGVPARDSFSLIIIVIAVLFYIWFTARTFQLSFFGAVGTFLVSHAVYLMIVFLVFSFVNLGEDRLFNIFKEKLGLRAIISTYLSDVKKVTSSGNILSFVRIRVYHL